MAFHVLMCSVMLLQSYSLSHCCEQVEAQFEKTTTEVEAAEQSTLSSILFFLIFICFVGAVLVVT